MSAVVHHYFALRASYPALRPCVAWSIASKHCDLEVIILF